MSGVLSITVEDDEADLRLDRWFKQRFPDLAHGRLERLLRTGQVRVDGRRAKAGARLTPGQVIRVPPLTAPGADTTVKSPVRPAPLVRESDLQALRAAILLEDDWVLALNKPPGLAVQGGTGQTRYLDAMLGALGAGTGAARLVHRLDKDTSGVLLVAKSAPAARALTASFRSRDARKVYWALVVGAPETQRGLIDLALEKQPGRGGEKVGAALDDGGKPAQTLFRVVEQRRGKGRGAPALSWLVLMPLTGRTHQLRAHCAALGTPIVGDGKYGGRAAFPEGFGPQLMLHAREIALPHPDDGTTLRVAAPLPPHMAEAWRDLGLDARKSERAADELQVYAEGLAHSPPGTRPKPKPKVQQSAPRSKARAKLRTKLAPIARPKAASKAGPKVRSKAGPKAGPKARAKASPKARPSARNAARPAGRAKSRPPRKR